MENERNIGTFIPEVVNAPAVPQDLAPQPVKRRVGVDYGFVPGHPRYGGRVKKQERKAAREIAKELGFEPIEFMVHIVTTGTIKTKLKNGKIVDKPIEDAERMKTLRDLVPYLLPKLAQVQMTGQNGGPVEIEASDKLAVIMSDPELAAAAQDLALAIAKRESAALLNPPTENSDNNPTENVRAI